MRETKTPGAKMIDGMVIHYKGVSPVLHVEMFSEGSRRLLELTSRF